MNIVLLLHSNRDYCVVATQEGLSQTGMCLSQTQMHQLACPKSINMVRNRVPVARHGLILGEDAATAFRKLFKHLSSPPGPMFGPETAAERKIYLKKQI